MNHLREIILTEILEIIKTEVEMFETGPVCRAGSHHEDRMCDALNYGSLLLGVRQTFPVFQRRATNSIKGTLLDLSFSIRKNLKVKTLDHFVTTIDCSYSHQHRGTGHHSSCERILMLSLIDSTLEDARILVEEVFLHRFLQQQE